MTTLTDQKDDTRKTAILFKELARLNIDIAALRKTWLSGENNQRN